MIKRNGGLTFFRIGRLGGSFYLAKRRVDMARHEWSIALQAGRYEIGATLVTIAAIIGWGV